MFQKYGNTEIAHKETIEITRTKQINRIEHEHHKHKTLAVWTSQKPGISSGAPEGCAWSAPRAAYVTMQVESPV